MRTTRYMYSEKLNPFMAIVATAAEMVKKTRIDIHPDNPYRQAEHQSVDAVEAGIKRARIARDSATEQIFDWLYNHPAQAPWLDWLQTSGVKSGAEPEICPK